MESADDDVAAKKSAVSAARLYRDGLLLAVFVMTALRLRSVISLSFGTNLHAANDGYLITLQEEDTKSRRPEMIPVHPDIARRLTRYLDVHRPILLGKSSTASLFLSCDGSKLGVMGIWRALRGHTFRHLGVHINPHFIRHCIATHAAIERPEALADLATVLQHRDFRVTQRHYVLANSLRAHRVHQDSLAVERERPKEFDDLLVAV